MKGKSIDKTLYKGVLSNMDENADYKSIEDMLFEYRGIPIKIRRNEIEIKLIESTYEGIRGKGDNDIKESTPTNQTTNSVENSLIIKEEKILRLKQEIETLKLKKEMIENAYNSLSKDEKGIIASRYFDYVPVKDISFNLDLTEDGVYKACRRIIENKLANYMIAML